MEKNNRKKKPGTLKGGKTSHGGELRQKSRAKRTQFRQKKKQKALKKRGRRMERKHPGLLFLAGEKELK